MWVYVSPIKFIIRWEWNTMTSQILSLLRIIIVTLTPPSSNHLLFHTSFFLFLSCLFSRVYCSSYLLKNLFIILFPCRLLAFTLHCPSRLACPSMTDMCTLRRSLCPLVQMPFSCCLFLFLLFPLSSCPSSPIKSRHVSPLLHMGDHCLFMFLTMLFIACPLTLVMWRSMWTGSEYARLRSFKT